METKLLKINILHIVWRILAGALCLGAAGCPSAGIYSAVPPAYNLAANQDKKVYLWVESPRSAGADVEATGALVKALREHMAARAKIKPDNIRMPEVDPGRPILSVQSPEATALQAGAELVLCVRIEEYELLPMSLRNYYSGRMTTRSLLVDATTGQRLWPGGDHGKVHDIVIELGQGERSEILSRMSAGTAHCILRNLYPIMKIHYKNSDERVSLQDAFELETF